MPRGMNHAGAVRRGRPSAIARVSTTDLRRELERRQSMAHELIQQREAITAELEALQVEIGPAQAINGFLAAPPPRRGPGRPKGSGAGRPAGAGRVGRPRKEGGLVDTLRKALSGITLSVSEVSDAVKRAGYKTKSANFRTIVNQALISNSSLFKKVARGQYTAK